MADAKLQRDADRGEAVGHIMPAGHGQQNVADLFDMAVAIADDDVEDVAARNRPHIFAANVRLRRKAVGDDATILHARQDGLHFGMIEAQQSGAVEGDVADKLDEGVLHPVEAAIMVKMFGIDIGDHRDRAVEPQEAAVALIGFHDHPVAVAQPRVGAIAVDDAAVDDRGIDPARVQQRGDHRRRRGLAMGAGDRDGGFEAHQFGQHFRAADHGNPGFQRQFDFGVAALDRGRRDNHGGVAQIFGLVADHHLDTLGAQPFHHIAFGHVGTLHAIAQIMHHFGDAGHADAADADEMDRSDVGADTLHAIPPKYGEGNRRKAVVEGKPPTRRTGRIAPSVSPVGCHLPVPERISISAITPAHPADSAWWASDRP